ncbi:hypothetical protein [Leptospira bouyouniensis]|uniref:hypothetical protein n=1 Tax=Leptospira bouyouniensis TaxID=2484911 RepID=UPI001090ED2B|nr:hypothetical protein [Leptospira bouyouniensis]TGM74783.1 hypothetical protein EHQ99_17565 [Leptospira bouyouniensis]
MEIIDGKMTNHIGVLGSLASILGIIVVLLQVLEVKSESNLIKGVIQKTRKDIEEKSKIHDFARAIEIIGHIKTYITIKNISLIYYNSDQLKNEATRLSQSVNDTQSKKLSDLITQLNINVSQIGKDIMNASFEFDYSKYMEMLNELQTQLIIISAQNSKESYDKQ